MTSEYEEYILINTSLNDQYNGSPSFPRGNFTEGIYEFYAETQIVILIVLCLAIIIGNTCVLAAIRLSERGRKSRMNFFIMHLAVADLLVGLMVALPDLVTKITIEWHGGNVMCKIVQFLQAVVTNSSTYMLVSLSIDRYNAVARPMKFSKSGYEGRILVIASWSISVLFALPTLYLFQETTREGRIQCWLEFPQFWHWQLFITSLAFTTFFLPTIIIAACYIAIIYIIWSKSRGYQPSESSQGFGLHQSGSCTPTRMTISDSRHSTGRGIIPQAKVRTIKMTLIIILVFILCWSPFFVYNLLDVYELVPSDNPISSLIQSAAPLNSAVNPIIYGMFSTRICKYLRRIQVPPCLKKLTCCCFKSTPCKRRRLPRSGKRSASQATDQTLMANETHKLTDLRLSPVSLKEDIRFIKNAVARNAAGLNGQGNYSSQIHFQEKQKTRKENIVQNQGEELRIDKRQRKKERESEDSLTTHVIPEDLSPNSNESAENYDISGSKARLSLELKKD